MCKLTEKLHRIISFCSKHVSIFCKISYTDTFHLSSIKNRTSRTISNCFRFRSFLAIAVNCSYTHRSIQLIAQLAQLIYVQTSFINTMRNLLNNLASDTGKLSFDTRWRMHRQPESNEPIFISRLVRTGSILNKCHVNLRPVGQKSISPGRG